MDGHDATMTGIDVGRVQLKALRNEQQQRRRPRPHTRKRGLAMNCGTLRRASTFKTLSVEEGEQ